MNGVAPSRLRGALLTFAALAAACTAAPAPRAPGAGPLCLALGTSLGEIRIELDRAAAPLAVAAIARAAAGGRAVAGLEFDYARPRLELRLPPPRGAEGTTVEAELDAGALGLDRDRLAEAGEAMDWIQLELFPALRRPIAERRPTPAGRAWVE